MALKLCGVEKSQILRWLSLLPRCYVLNLCVRNLSVLVSQVCSRMELRKSYNLSTMGDFHVRSGYDPCRLGFRASSLSALPSMFFHIRLLVFLAFSFLVKSRFLALFYIPVLVFS